MKFFVILLLLPFMAYALPEPEPSPKIGDGVVTAQGEAAIEAGKAIAASDPAAKSLKPVPLVVTKRSENPALQARAKLEARDQWCEIIVPVGYVLGCFSGPDTAYPVIDYLNPGYTWDILCYEEYQYIEGNPSVSLSFTV
jgi:hypothetical protein